MFPICILKIKIYLIFCNSQDHAVFYLYDTSFTFYAEPSTTLITQVGHKFPEVFRLKQGSYADLPSTKISELMKSTSLDVSFHFFSSPLDLHNSHLFLHH